MSGSGNLRRSAARGSRNHELLLNFFQQNRRRRRALDLARDRAEAEERGRVRERREEVNPPMAIMIDDSDSGKKHILFNFHLDFNRKSFA